MKYKQLAEEREREIATLANELQELKGYVTAMQANFIEQASASMQSEEAKEILRLFAAKAGNRDELVLLVRALAKLPA